LYSIIKKTCKRTLIAYIDSYVCVARVNLLVVNKEQGLEVSGKKNASTCDRLTIIVQWM
jgi:hypothetical protein